MKKLHLVILILSLLLILSGCSGKVKEQEQSVTKDDSNNSSRLGSIQVDQSQVEPTLGKEKDQGNGSEENMPKDNQGNSIEYKYNHELTLLEDNYRTYYEIFLYSFYDSNGDGIGDINGLIEKLDYINDGNPETDSDLGFTGIWLMPIMPSNTYHKYDVLDYYSIDPQYGTMEDFDRLVKECNKRGIKLILDLVLNHSSQLHPWFLSALKSLAIPPCGQKVCKHEELCREHNPYVNYYNFVEGKPNKGEYYHTGVGDWYYEAVFSTNMPDFNLADSNLRKDIEDIMRFWLDKGIGGFRLDAALHYYTDDTERNTEVLTWLNNYIKNISQDNYMVAEVWTNFTTFTKYYSSGIDSVFNFAFAMETGKIVETLNYKGAENSAKAFGDAMLQVQKGLRKYSDSAIDAPFFTNHDTARAAGFFSGNEDKIKIAGGMNLMMNGNVFVYYGEELGMNGSGRDENKRAPIVWSKTDLTGMTKGPEAMEEIIHGFGSVEEQMEDPLSIYHYYKRAIRLRNENPEIARGELEVMKEIADPDLCAITKTYQGSKILMIYNISEAEKKITISKSQYGYQGIRGYLTVKGEEVLLDGETVILPSYSIVILK